MERDMFSIHDPESIELLELYKKIIQGYHALVEESIATERHFAEFVQQQEDVRQKWSSAEKETHRLRSMVQGSATDRSKAEGQITNMRQQLQKEFDRRKDAEGRVKELERVLDVFRDVLLGDRTMTQEDRQRLYETANILNRTDDHAANTSWVNRKSEDFLESRISYDRSDDEEEEVGYATSTSRKNVYKSNEGEVTETSRVIEKPDGDIEIIAKTRVRIPESGGPVEARSSLTTRPRRSVNFADPLIQRRSQSVPRIVDESREVRARRSKHEIDGVISSDVTSQESDADSVPGLLNLYAEPQKLRRRSKSLGRGLDARQHNFVAKRFLRTEKCCYCEKPFKFGSSGVKCSECIQVCHAACQGFLPFPCAPITEPVARKASGHSLDLSTFTTDKGLFIPDVISQCINHIEKHGLGEEGLYRTPGFVSEVQRFKREFVRTRSTVSLSPNTDVHVACSLIKEFLMSLKEPLITYRLWAGFAAAAGLSGNEETYRLIGELPPANRCTLAKIMLHLRKIADIPVIRMTIKNLSISFAPTLVGPSKSSPLSAVELEAENLRQQMIMGKLFAVNRDYWSDVLTRNHGPSLNDTANTSNYFDVPEDSFMLDGVRGGNSFTGMARSFFQTSSSKIDRSRPRQLQEQNQRRNFESPMMSD